MNAMSWAAPQRVAEPAVLPAETSRGVLTGVSLADVRRLCLPPTIGAFGRLRPPLDRTALMLSLELAYMTYTLDVDAWMHAGWTDVSIQVDNRLQSGLTVGESESVGNDRIRGLMNAWKVARARMALKEINPVSQIMGALRQREKSDTIKAVTMMHPAGAGKFVVAIGFMGTGSRFYDWFSNFRFATEDGFHKGFYQLTQVFEQSASRILFPDTAAALGLDALSLQDILTEMRTPNSRFTLWMAGHSQGAAVMQVFCHRLLSAWGIPARHMVGYGFASPTTSVGGSLRDTGAYPLYHVINSDDLVPRIGALMHLGLGLRYDADAALRQAAYGWSDEPAEAEMRATAETLMHHIEDTPTMLETLVAMLTIINDEKTEESLNALLEKRWAIAPLDKAFTFAGGKAKDSLNHMVRYSRVAYHAVTGRRMNEETVRALMAEMRPIIAEYPLRKLLAALRDRYYPPHMMCRAHHMTGAYGYIAQTGFDRLTPFIWQGGRAESVRQMTDTGYAVFTPDLAAEPLALRRYCAPPRMPVRHSPRRRGVSARRVRMRVVGVCKTPPRRRRVLRPIAAGMSFMRKLRHGKKKA